MTAPISGYTRLHNTLTQEYDVEDADATRVIDTYLNTERESISDTISDSEVDDLAELIYTNSKYWN